MNGIKIISDLCFKELFHVSFSKFDCGCYLIHPESFDVPGSWVAESGYSESEEKYVSGIMKQFEADVVMLYESKLGILFNYGYYSSREKLCDYLDAVSSDWSTILAVKGNIENPLNWLKDYFKSDNRAVIVNKCVNHIFASVDGAYYVVFSRDMDLIASLRERLEQIPNVHLESVDLNDYVFIL